MWLPKSYHVEFTSFNESMVIVFNETSNSINEETLEVASLQPGTAYNISVTPCNMAGCNKSCDIHSVLTPENGKLITHNYITLLSKIYIAAENGTTCILRFIFE